MLKIKKKSLVIAITLVVLAGCAPKEHLADCNSTTGSYVCYDNEGRDATYARWNFDTVETYNVLNIQGSYPPVPGTTGPWTTVNITAVNSTGSMGVETGTYTYYNFLTNSGERKFTFWVKRYVGDDQDPFVKNLAFDPYGFAFLNITNIDASGKLSGVFEANVWNLADTTETGVVKYRFENIELQ